MTETQPRSARQQILDTATALFAESGYRAVGIDTIIARSGVAKMTLYRHFPSKDALIVAYLQARDATFWAWFHRTTDPVTEPRAKIEAMFTTLADFANSSACLGCPFSSAAAEFPLGHPVHAAALTHKRAVHARFLELATAANLHQPEQLADALLLLMDGAFASARMFGPSNPAASVAHAVHTLIAAHTVSNHRLP